jgi:hypothetical protein
MGEGWRGGRSARPKRRSREWSTCVACKNLNRIKNFGANNFDIKRVCTFHTINSTRRQRVYKNTKTFSRIDISLSSNETVSTECGNEITDPSKRRKLFNVSTKTSACKNLLIWTVVCLTMCAVIVSTRIVIY